MSRHLTPRMPEGPKRASNYLSCTKDRDFKKLTVNGWIRLVFAATGRIEEKQSVRSLMTRYPSVTIHSSLSITPSDNTWTLPSKRGSIIAFTNHQKPVVWYYCLDWSLLRLVPTDGQTTLLRVESNLEARMAKSTSSKGGGRDKKSSKSANAAEETSTSKVAAGGGISSSKKHSAAAHRQQGTDNTTDGESVDVAASQYLYSWVVYGLCVYLTFIILYNAYNIRMHAIKEYGPVIHEFDPYFNFRATEVSSSAVRRQSSISWFWFCVPSLPSVVQLLGHIPSSFFRKTKSPLERHDVQFGRCSVLLLLTSFNPSTSSSFLPSFLPLLPLFLVDNTHARTHAYWRTT